MPTTGEEPFGDGDFFPEKKPVDYPAFHNYKRDREAARLKAMGWTLEDICEHLNLTDSRTGEIDVRRAAAAVRRGLHQVSQFTVEEKRVEQLHALEMMKRHLWEQLDREHVMVQQGKVIFHAGMPMEDRRFQLEVMDRLSRIEQQQMDLLGTKAATRFSVEADQIGTEISQLIAMINADNTTTVERVDDVPVLESGEDTDD